MVFAERCARAIPASTRAPHPDRSRRTATGKDYMTAGTILGVDQDGRIQNDMRQMVSPNDFLKDNYLSTELRFQ